MTLKIKNGVRNRYIFVIDAVLIAVCIFLSYMLRFEFGSMFRYYSASAYWMLGVSEVLKLFIYYRFGLYRRLWVYASIAEARLILIAVTCASAAVSVLMLVLKVSRVFIGFPRSILVIDYLLSLIAVGGVRFLIRFLASSDFYSAVARNNYKDMKRALIIGAGDAGAIVCREIQKNPQLKVIPVGFLDDDRKKLNQEIYGFKVLGATSEISRVLDKYKIDEVFFAIPSAPGHIVRVVTEVCRKRNIPFRTMPGIYELLGGKVNISRLREVEITDLLRRDPVKLDQDNIGPMLHDRVILITGAGGSIGREITRQVARWSPKQILLLGHGENSIFETMTLMRETFPEMDMKPVIVDVRDLKRVDAVFEKYRPQIVFHAAAHKHVPLMESNIPEAITNNVIGTRNVVKTAKKYGVERFVMISTDKAVRPINIMGATKRLAENIVLNESMDTDANYTVVRFGNVLGSRGSVVPLFKAQIKKGGPVTVTDPNMERYFMTIPEAVYLVLEAAGLSHNQETFVLDMGKQVRILDLAEDLIRLSGLEPGRDIEIKFTGMRPGEKLSEDLWNEGQVLEPTLHPDIFKLDRDDLIPAEKLDAVVEQLHALALNEEDEKIRELLNETIPDADLLDN